MARLYSNENFPLAVVKILRILGHDVLTTQDAGRAGLGIPDEEVMAFAVEEQRILVTINRKDFIQIHKKTPIHAGIIICTENRNREEFAQKIHEIINTQNLENQIIRVYRG
jgi:uncharacterized protein with PIN domain